MMWKLFIKAKKLSGKLAESAIDNRISDTELRQWQEESVEGEKTIGLFSDPEIRYRLVSQFSQNNKAEAVERMKRAIQKRQRRKILQRISAIAALMLLLIGVSVFLFHHYAPVRSETDKMATIIPGRQQAILVLANGERMELSQITRINETDGTAITRTRKGEVVYKADSFAQPAEMSYNTIIVPRYGEYSVILSDGTQVKLNSESELRYPTAFSGNQREVFLKGEAYLEVSKSNLPFIVHTYDAQVKVYGTRFDIDSYNPEQIKVVLVEGKVGVSSSLSEEVLLHPNQLAQIHHQKGITIKKDINPAYYIAWQEGYFAFEEQRLEEILSTLSRWYNFDVLYSRPELKDVHFTASLKKDQPLENILQQFMKTQSISFRITGNQIIVE